MTEVFVVVVESKDHGNEVCVFTDPKVATDWFEKFGKVSIHRVEIDDSKDFIMLEKDS